METENKKPSLNKLLIVDDEPAILKLMSRRLEQEGYQILVENSGAGALETIKNHPDLRCLLLDLSLPDMDGLQVLQHSKQLRPSLPVLVITGHHNESKALQALELGALDYLTKPIWFEYLIQVLSLQKAA